MRRSWSIGAIAAAALVGGCLLWSIAGSRSTAGGAGRTHVASMAANPPAIIPPPAAGSTERASGGAGRPAPRSQPKGKRRAYDRQRADRIRERAAALRARAPVPAALPSAAGRAGSAAEPLPTTSGEEARRRQYIQDAVREQYFPIAGACYEELLTRQPSASGKVVLSFAIVGDGEDGVVDRVEVVDGTTMNDSEFTLCMRESLYTTIFEPPPPGAEETTVVYPVDLDPTPPNDATASTNSGNGTPAK